MKCLKVILGFLFCTGIIQLCFAQIAWEKYQDNPVFTDTTGGFEDAYAPSILFIDNTYHMWYARYDGTYERICYATSLDGIMWEPYVNNPVLDVGDVNSYEETSVTEHCVIYDGSTFHMWYTGMNSNVSPWREAIGYATSPDGINWTKYSDQPVLDKGTAGTWDDTKIFCPSVVFDGAIFHMWYSGGSTGPIRHIGYATSSDGYTWTRYVNNPVLRNGSSLEWDYPRAAQPRVFFDGTKYHMFYGGGEAGKQSIGYAKSHDKITWTKNINNPVLDKGESGSWDDNFVNIPSVIIDTTNSIFRMWYSGSDEGYLAKIGYATAPNILDVPGDFATIQAAIDEATNGDLVLVDEGTYYENINFKGKAITVASQFYMDGDTSHISKTIIDGSQSDNPDSGSVVYFVSDEDTTSVLCGFTITGGSGTQLINFVGVAAYGGGGILVHSGAKIINNRISGNHISTSQIAVGAGLAITSANPANIIIEDNEVTYNTCFTSRTTIAGGILIRPRWNDGFINIKNNKIKYNSVTCSGTYKAIGGGIGVSINLPTAGTIIIENNEITFNELHCIAAMGSGIYVVYWEPGGNVTDEYPSPIICNNIIANNFSEDKGGGIGIWTVEDTHNPNSIIITQPVFINNTVVNNKATDGSGIFNFDSYPLLMNNILWDDTTSGSREIFNDDINYPEYSDKTNDGELIIHSTDIQGGWEGWGNIDLEPFFNDTLYHLSNESPCIDAGHDSTFFYDIEDRENVGYAEWPAMGTLRNDQGAYGGPLKYDSNILLEVIDFITDIPAERNGLPFRFSLRQNYPNPFNPVTMINYQLPMTSDIELVVFNTLGQKVKTLVSQNQKAGYHQVEWDASGFASGIYYYRIEAGEFQDVKKMILIK